MARKKWWEFTVSDKLQEKRIILLFEAINNKVSYEVISKIIAHDTANNNLPIWLYINSIGGNVSSGLAIIDIMKAVKSPIYTVITGEACSMGSIIAVCGDKRFITEYGYFMGHPMSFGIDDYVAFAEDRYIQAMKVFNLLVGIYKKHTKLTKNDLEKMKNGELWLNAKQCIKKGIVDEILKEIK